MAERSTALTFLFEGEVLCEVSALVVPTQEEERAGVVDLERPEVENTLGEKMWEEGRRRSQRCVLTIMHRP